MKLLPHLCFFTVFIFTADGQMDLCTGVLDFALCKDSDTFNCNKSISACFCKSGKPFCRCNNFKDEFYLGENCNQKWTTLTFALVASLPGITLALVVGVTVHIIHICQKSSKSTGESKQQSSSEETMFPGIVFASDVNARPNGHPPSPSPPQGGFTAQPASSRPYSIQGNSRPFAEKPSMGDSRPPYSPSASMHPTADRPPMGGPRPPNSILPSSPRAGGSFNKPGLGGPQQPYSYTAGPGQVLSNPYAKSRNPYEERSPSPDQYRSYDPPSSPQAYDDRRTGPSSAPSYAAPDYSNRSAFPRAQINRMY
ncbi:translation initiation factor IF-2 isoform X2 [Pygocentrus nattereri]|uniref:translation initiation factor IF-2 isoform X2 n=1 Tax=Pygocentrus nattereri TaxID=42514 RepID=UPI001890B74B|nr:translation initiation factor IF-2 isoform X2 [Pygocentrus nattereri]